MRGWLASMEHNILEFLDDLSDDVLAHFLEDCSPPAFKKIRSDETDGETSPFGHHFASILPEISPVQFHSSSHPDADVITGSTEDCTSIEATLAHQNALWCDDLGVICNQSFLGTSMHIGSTNDVTLSSSQLETVPAVDLDAMGLCIASDSDSDHSKTVKGNDFSLHFEGGILSSSFNFIPAKQSRPADLSQRLAHAIRSNKLSHSFLVDATDGWKLPSTLELSSRILGDLAVEQLDRLGCYQFPKESTAKLPKYIPVKRIVCSATEAAIKAHLLQLAQGVVTDDKDLTGSVGSILQKCLTPFGSVMQRVGFYMMEGLQARMKGVTAQDYIKPIVVNREIVHHVEKLGSRMPLLTLTMDAINDIIVDCVEQSDVIHIVDLAGWSGQWGPLFRSLAGRPPSPPTVRITVVSAPPDTPWGTGPTLPPKLLEMEVMKAAAEAGVDCLFSSVVSRLEDLSSEMLELRAGEMLAVSGCMRLQQLPDRTVLRSNPRNAFLQKVRSWNPRVVALAGIEVDQNMPFFLKRVEESIDFFHTMFEIFEALVGSDSSTRLVVERTLLRREIIHTIACEGSERIQRDERIDKWQSRMSERGFRECDLNPMSIQTLTSRLKSFNPNFGTSMCKKALMFTWKGKAVIGIHAWT